MRYFFISFLLFLSISPVFAQTHQQALEEFDRLKQKSENIKEDIKKEAEALEKIILRPDSADIIAAKQENVDVFRILPREKYAKEVFKVRGGGAFYSFIKQSHSYNDIPQISLEQNYLRVGFYGASYGFIADLGEIPLSQIGKTTKGVDFLINYQPPTVETEARAEYKKISSNFEQNEISFGNRRPAIVGHSFILRAVSFGEADVLVAFKIHRKDTDGSLIIFWKLIEHFAAPTLDRRIQSDTEIQAKILIALRNKGYNDVTVDISTKPFTLRGTYPKGKLAEIMLTALEANSGKPIKNEMSGQ